MRKFKFLYYIIFLVPLLSFSSSKEKISNYTVMFYPGYLKTEDTYDLGIFIRMFFQDGERKFVFVNKNTLKTKVASIKDCFFRNPIPKEQQEKESETKKSYNRYIKWADVENSNYVKTLFHFTNSPRTESENGLSHALTPVKGYFLTVDLCPSINPFEQDFFNKLVAISAKRGTPFPVTICISLVWLEKHEKKFNWLVEQVKKKKLDITWVNHTFSHFYLSDLVTTENFLLNPFSNLDLEFQEVEKALILRDQELSPIIRLPGLITNEKIDKKMRDYGLIPLGTDAWLAKNQQPKEGSIILVHGNGNEHEGIVKAMEILEKYSPQLWLPITKAIY